MHATPRPDSDRLVIEQQVRAKPSEVFADLTVPDRMVRWWGDRSQWWVTSAEVDLRPSGRFWVSWGNTKGVKDGMGAILGPSTTTEVSFSLSSDRTARVMSMSWPSGWSLTMVKQR
jgi:uncharacterized protein YndB with AHSA1/START domain